MNNFDKKGIEAQASQTSRNLCGQCNTAIEGNEFSAVCQDFFVG